MTQSLWTISEIVAATAGTCSGEPETEITGVSIDTRTLQPGDLYVALHGVSQDGHKYVDAAFEAGAAAALVEEKSGIVGPRCIRVPDTLRAMEALGRAARARTNAKVIAVTGSVGKTGTKEMLRLALSVCGKTHAAEKSYNNHWGVPLTLSRMPADTEFAVCEIGMNHANEITPLTRMVQPDIAIITTIAPVHIGYLGSLEAIAHAKAEIFDGLAAGGVAILNAAAPHLDILEAAAKDRGAGIRMFGADDAYASTCDTTLRDGVQIVDTRIGEHHCTIELSALGQHHVTNSLAVLTACEAAGANLALAAKGLSGFAAQPGRGASERIDTPDGPITLLDESYNANPASVGAAITVLAQTGAPEARRIAVLGDMLELGDDADTLHAGLATPLANAEIDLVLTCGPHMASLRDALPAAMRGPYRANAEEMRDEMLGTVQPGDIIMIKGSLGSRMGGLVAALRSHFDGHTT